MKELILDYERWRCGGNTFISRKNGLGRYPTFLQFEGVQSHPKHDRCCLGQFALQLNKNIKPKDIRALGKPKDINVYIPLLTKKRIVDFEDRKETLIIDSMFSTKAIEINDDLDSTIKQKIEKLTSLCKEYNYKLTVINLPNYLK